MAILNARPWALTLLFVAACGESVPPVGLDSGSRDAAPGADDAAPSPPRIDRFEVSATRVRMGDHVTLSYAVSTATSVTLVREVAGVRAVLHHGAPSSADVDSGALDANAAFHLIAEGPTGRDERTLSVAVTPIEQPNITIRAFEATPNPVEAGGTTRVRWTVEGADRVRVLEGPAVLVDTTTRAASGEVALAVTAAPLKLRLEASAPGVLRTASLEIYTRDAAELRSFVARPAVFTAASGPSRLRWDTRGESVAISADGAAVPGVPPNALSSSVSVTVAAPTLFTLEVQGRGRSARARRVVSPGGATEREPNDDAARAQVVTNGALGELAGPDDVDVYRVRVPAGAQLYAELSEAGERCTRGVGLRLLTADGAERVEQDAGDRDVCARLDPYDDPGARDLPEGDYLLVVDGARAPLRYGLALLVRGGSCGDQLVQQNRGERCDDGGRADGDGCSQSCALEYTDTITLPGPAAQRTGALAAGTVDHYRLVVTAPVTVAIETGAPALGRCEAADTVLELRDSALALVASDDDTRGLCAAIPARAGVGLTPGEYVLTVRSFDRAVPLAAYALSVSGQEARCGDDVVSVGETCDDGNTAPGDGCAADCTVERIAAPGGALDMDVPAGAVRVVDVDVTVPGSSITATTSDGMGGCGVDTRLILSRNGAYLGYQSDGAGCARLDPRRDAFATNLEPGRYRLHVVGEGATGGPVHLDVGVREPRCGNGLLESRAQETCDDGNTVDGDACSAICELVVGGVAMGPGQPPVVFGGMVGAGNVPQLFDLQLSAAANLYLEVGIPVLGQCLSGDPVAEVFDASMAMVVMNDDARGLCSVIDPAIDRAAQLAAGRYTLAVRSFDRSSPIPAFQVRIELRGVNCGDGVPGADEACDDGNNTSGDGCSGTCTVE